MNGLDLVIGELYNFCLLDYYLFPRIRSLGLVVLLFSANHLNEFLTPAALPCSSRGFPLTHPLNHSAGT